MNDASMMVGPVGALNTPSLTGPQHIDLRQGEGEDGSTSLLGELLGVMRRRIFVLSLWLVACIAAAGAFLLLAQPEFAATAQVVLEPRLRTPMASDPSSTALAPTLDSAQADSQLQVIKSGRNLRFVFDTLKLENDPAYAEQEPGLLGRILQLVSFGGGKTDSSSEEQARRSRERAYQIFSNQVAVRRLGQSYVLEISFRAATPRDAARITNSITAAYIRDQVLFRAASDYRGSDFLQGRISSVQTQKQAATEAVEKGVIPDIQFPDSDARIVSAALEPLTKSYPQTKLILLLAALFGIVTGVGAVVLHHSLDRTVRSPEQLRRKLGVDCLALFPRVRGRQGQLSCTFALDRPDSEFARTLRVLRTAMFASGNYGGRVSIGVVSCLPGEGRSTIAANLAYLLSTSDDRVLLIDADLQNPSLTRRIAPGAGVGLNDLLLDRKWPAELPEIPLSSRLSMVPAASAGRAGDPNAFLGSPGMQAALARLDGERTVILDLPALGVSSDAQAVGHLLSGVLLLAAVDRTTVDQLSEAIRVLGASNTHIFGIILNDLETPRRIPKSRREPVPKTNHAQYDSTPGKI